MSEKAKAMMERLKPNTITTENGKTDGDVSEYIKNVNYYIYD